MRNRKLFPCIQSESHLFIKDNALWSLQITNTTEMEYIDFEHDLWRHEDQYIISKNSQAKTKKLFNFKDIGVNEADEELKIA